MSATAPAPRSDALRRIARAASVLATIAIIGAMWAGRAVLVPLVLAGLTALVLAPAVRALLDLRVPRPLAAAIVLGTTVVGVVGLAGILLDPARGWLERAPKAIARMEVVVRDVHAPLERLSDAARSLSEMAEGGADRTGRRLVAVADSPTPVSELLRQAPVIVTSAIATLFLSLMLLLHGDTELRKLVSIMPGLRAKKDLVHLVRHAQSELSRYLGAVTVINLALGAATAAVAWFAGLPDPLLWGGLTALLNFAPYIGPIGAVALLTLAGFAEFSDPAHALVVPVAFLVLHAIEGQVVTPMVVGRRLDLDPVAIFAALLLLGWLWGVAGLLLAVPMLACVRIVAARIAPDGSVARLLGHGAAASGAG